MKPLREIEFIVAESLDVPNEDGGVTTDSIGVTNGDPEVAKKVLTEYFGTEPLYVGKAVKRARAVKSGASVGFRRWNSSWDPHAESGEVIYH